MKKLLLISAIVSVTLLTGCTEPKLTKNQIEDKYALCDARAKTAEAVMSARQSQVPMAEMMKIAKDNRMTKTYVIVSYKKEVYKTPSIRQQIINDFRDSAYSVCIDKLLNLANN